MQARISSIIAVSWSKNIPFRASFLAYLLAISPIFAAFALPDKATAQEIDIHQVDVSGVQLGMTPEQAIAAIKAFDPLMTVTKKYLTFAAPSFSFDGEAEELVERKHEKVAILNAVSGVHISGVSFEINGCFDHRVVDLDTINIEFSRVPGSEKVIAVRREKLVCQEPSPSVASITAGLLEKYPEAQATYRGKNGNLNFYGWLFDAHSRLISSATAKSKGVQQTMGLPSSVHSGDLYGLNAVVVASARNALLIDRFSVTLYDATALYDTVAQGKAAYQTLKARADAEGLKNTPIAPPQKF